MKQIVMKTIKNFAFFLSVCTAVLLAVGCDKSESPTTLPDDLPPGANVIQTLVAKGNWLNSENIQKQTVVITTDSEWEAFWSKINSNNPISELEMSIDFEQHQIIAVIDVLHMNGGWSIDITNITEYADKIVVTFTNLMTGDLTCALSQPYQIVKIPVSDKRIEFKCETQNVEEK